MTLDELMTKLKNYDVDTLIDMFKMNSDDLVETMEYYIVDNFDDLVEEVGELETPWDYD